MSGSNLRFPWLSHRTLAEVDETEQLRGKARRWGLSAEDRRRLGELTSLEQANNPMSLPSPPEAS